MSNRYRCSPGIVFVECVFRGDLWFRKAEASCLSDQAKIIKCAHCDKPAVRIDSQWPLFTGYNACAEHMDAEPREGNGSKRLRLCARPLPERAAWHLPGLPKANTER